MPHSARRPCNVTLRDVNGTYRSLVGCGARIMSLEEIEMVAIVARWGTNALLIGMAIVTYAVFVLAR